MFQGGDFSINRTLQSAINAEIALLRANQIAGNTTDFKMNIINGISVNACILSFNN